MPMQTLGVIFLVVVLVALIALIVYVESARRNIAISYASRRVGSQTFRGQETSLAAQDQHGRRYPGDLCVVGPGDAADAVRGVSA